LVKKPGTKVPGFLFAGKNYFAESGRLPIAVFLYEI